MLKHILKVVFLIIGGLIVLLALTTWLFTTLHPAFGADPGKTARETYARLPHYRDGKFINQIETSMNMGFREGMFVMLEFLRGGKGRQPESPPPVLYPDPALFKVRDTSINRLTWFGHSAFLLETGGYKILLDPMFGPSPAPHPLLGTKRFNSKLPVAVSDLPEIDAVAISHDHYDHLDYPSILELNKKVKLFVVPLGVDAHLKAWGIAPEKIRVLDWWDNTEIGQLKFTCTPARHFSGRGLFNRMSTLWCSWVIESGASTIYFSGDTGYGPHFKEIKERFGQINLALLECGQYNTRWEAIHMMPEQVAQAAADLGASEIIPIHWGAFTLSLHSWKEPVERLLPAASALNINVITPMIGEPVNFNGNAPTPQTRWWEDLQ